MAEAPPEKGAVLSIDREGNSDVHDILHCLCFQSYTILKAGGVTPISTVQ